MYRLLCRAFPPVPPETIQEWKRDQQEKSIALQKQKEAEKESKLSAEHKILFASCMVPTVRPLSQYYKDAMLAQNHSEMVSQTIMGWIKDQSPEIKSLLQDSFLYTYAEPNPSKSPVSAAPSHSSLSMIKEKIQALEESISVRSTKHAAALLHSKYIAEWYLTLDLLLDANIVELVQISSLVWQIQSFYKEFKDIEAHPFPNTKKTLHFLFQSSVTIMTMIHSCNDYFIASMEEIDKSKSPMNHIHEKTIYPTMQQDAISLLRVAIECRTVLSSLLVRFETKKTGMNHIRALKNYLDQSKHVRSQYVEYKRIQKKKKIAEMLSQKKQAGSFTFDDSQKEHGFQDVFAPLRTAHKQDQALFTMQQKFGLSEGKPSTPFEWKPPAFEKKCNLFQMQDLVSIVLLVWNEASRGFRCAYCSAILDVSKDSKDTDCVQLVCPHCHFVSCALCEKIVPKAGTEIETLTGVSFFEKMLGHPNGKDRGENQVDCHEHHKKDDNLKHAHPPKPRCIPIGVSIPKPIHETKASLVSQKSKLYSANDENFALAEDIAFEYYNVFKGNERKSDSRGFVWHNKPPSATQEMENYHMYLDSHLSFDGNWIFGLIQPTLDYFQSSSCDTDAIKHVENPKPSAEKGLACPMYFSQLPDLQPEFWGSKKIIASIASIQERVLEKRIYKRLSALVFLIGYEHFANAVAFIKETRPPTESLEMLYDWAAFFSQEAEKKCCELVVYGKY